jgi:hypothetical protein
MGWWKMSFSKKFDDDLLVVIVVDVVTQLMVRFDIVGNHARDSPQSSQDKGKVLFSVPPQLDSWLCEWSIFLTWFTLFQKNIARMIIETPKDEL